MSGYLLDSDWIVDALHGIDRSLRALVEIAPGGLAISMITYAEVYQGAFYARNSAMSLAGLRSFLVDKRLLPITPAIAERFAVRRGGLPRAVAQQVGDMDLFIAATALNYDLTLVTRNLRDFRYIPALSLYERG